MRYCLKETRIVFRPENLILEKVLENNETGISNHLEMPVYLGWEMGFEPTIFGTTIRRFNQLSYTHHRWRALLDSNQRLTA